MLNGFAAGAGPSPRMFGAGGAAGCESAAPAAHASAAMANHRESRVRMLCPPKTPTYSNPKRLGPIVKSFDDRPEGFSAKRVSFRS